MPTRWSVRAPDSQNSTLLLIQYLLKTKGMDVFPMDLVRETFGENVSNVFGGADFVNTNDSFLNLFANEVVSNVDVFCSFMEHIVICNVAGTFGVGVYGDWQVELNVETFYKLDGPKCVFCSFGECHVLSLSGGQQDSSLFACCPSDACTVYLEDVTSSGAAIILVGRPIGVRVAEELGSIVTIKSQSEVFCCL